MNINIEYFLGSFNCIQIIFLYEFFNILTHHKIFFKRQIVSGTMCML